MLVLKFLFWMLLGGAFICGMLFILGLICELLFLDDGSWRWGVRDDSDMK